MNKCKVQNCNKKTKKDKDYCTKHDIKFKLSGDPEKQFSENNFCNIPNCKESKYKKLDICNGHYQR